MFIYFTKYQKHIDFTSAKIMFKFDDGETVTTTNATYFGGSAVDLAQSIDEIEFFYEDQDFSVKRYWGVENPDKNNRPKLIINYLNANKQDIN